MKLIYTSNYFKLNFCKLILKIAFITGEMLFVGCYFIFYSNKFLYIFHWIYYFISKTKYIKS
jgi:hypothetical protein